MGTVQSVALWRRPFARACFYKPAKVRYENASTPRKTAITAASDASGTSPSQ